MRRGRISAAHETEICDLMDLDSIHFENVLQPCSLTDSLRAFVVLRVLAREQTIFDAISCSPCHPSSLAGELESLFQAVASRDVDFFAVLARV